MHTQVNDSCGGAVCRVAIFTHGPGFQTSNRHPAEQHQWSSKIVCSLQSRYEASQAGDAQGVWIKRKPVAGV